MLQKGGGADLAVTSWEEEGSALAPPLKKRRHQSPLGPKAKHFPKAPQKGGCATADETGPDLYTEETGVEFCHIAFALTHFVVPV